ncbi:MAG TPA: hypothetical protein VNT81_04130 [Vicinamibacterales bacterium]|nr:hypothetical protein [Vicinamibacterales bacterium]
MNMSIRSIAAAALVLMLATPALAGPPLICHPFQTEGGRLLTWGTGSGWNTPDRSYNLSRLVADTTAVLTADAPILTRMENIRRATIYATRDPQVANELLKAVIGRALATSTNSAAWFDAGYLIESYKQAVHIRETRNPDLRAWAAVDETIKVDGYNWVRKAMAMTTASAEMEFAASLMTRGSIASAHRAKALAATNKGSALAKNLATSAEFF